MRKSKMPFDFVNDFNNDMWTDDELRSAYKEKLPDARRAFKQERSTKVNPLSIRVGDIVEIHFTHMGAGNKGPFQARVLRDYGHGINYLALDGKLRNGVGLDMDGCSYDWVTKIVSRKKGAPIYQSRNAFYKDRGAKIERGLHHFFGRSNKEWVGEPRQFVAWILRDKFFVDCPNGINTERFYNLWKKAGWPGLISASVDEEGEPRYPFHLHAKSFSKWVMANIQKIKKTKDEAARDALFHERHEMGMYDSDMASDYGRASGRRAPVRYYVTRDAHVTRIWSHGYAFVRVPEGSPFQVGELAPDDWDMCLIWDKVKKEDNVDAEEDFDDWHDAIDDYDAGRNLYGEN